MIRVRNIEESLDFYCNKLGLVETRRSENEKGRFTLIFLAAPGNLENAKINQSPLIELTYNWPDEKGETEQYQSGRNFGHLAFEVDNIYDFCQKLIDKNVIINRPPKDGYMAFIKSPDGVSIELLQKGDTLEICEPFKSMKNIGSW
ncbi:MAG: lactoylglutathione lyase [Myxococcota bacterium]|jgi:lactoylglutathione lyase